jgi:hypothetical protein
MTVITNAITDITAFIYCGICSDNKDFSLQNVKTAKQAGVSMAKIQKWYFVVNSD